MNTRSVACAWQAATDLLWTQFDDSTDWVIYQPASSTAHLVSDAARRLWMLASNGRAADPEGLAAMGQTARRIFEQRFSRDHAVSRYRELFGAPSQHWRKAA